MTSTGVAAPPRTRLPLLTWVMAAGTFLMGTSEFLVAGLLPEIARDLHVSVPQAGLAITVFAIGMIIGSPLMVLLTLRLPRRTTLTLLLVVFALGHVAAALSGTFALLLAARFLSALATGAFWAVSGLVAADAAGAGARTRAMSVVQGGGMLATVLGVPLGSFAGQVGGWRGPFWVLSALALVAAVLVARLVPADHPSKQVPTLRGELTALRSGRLWLVLLTCAGVTGGVLSVYSYIAPLLTDRTGLPESAVPIALVLFGITALAGSIVAGRLGDARPYATTLIAGTVTLLAVGGLAAVSTLPVPTLLLFSLLGLTGLSANPILGVLAMHFGGSAPTLATALTPSAFNIGTAVGTGITAAALENGFGDLAPLVVGGIGAVVVLIAFGALTIVTRSTAPDVACAPA